MTCIYRVRDDATTTIRRFEPAPMARLALLPTLRAALALALLTAPTGCTVEPLEPTSSASGDTTSTTLTATEVEDSLLDTSAMFTSRDLEQEADLTDAVEIELVSGEDVSITAAGVYVLFGTATDTTIVVDADDEAKVQLVLDGVTLTNQDAPAIYVKSADKVFVTTTADDNVMQVTGTFVADGDTNLDAVIFSKDDLVLNGTGKLTLTSNEGNGIACKDDLKVTGGTWVVTAAADGLEANDSIRIAGGVLTLQSWKDALHAEDDEDDTSFIYIAGGTLTINASDDGIQASAVVQIDGGTIDIQTSTEGIEGTAIQINAGTVTIYATDDGINAAAKSSAYDVVIIVNGGTISVTVGSGDTDAFDSNGDLYVNGGVIDVTAPTSSFDYDGTGELNGGTVTVNGTVVTTLPSSMMGGGGGGPGGH